MRPKLNRKGFVQLRKSDGVRGEVLRRARAAGNALGAGYDVNIKNGRSRVRASVVADSVQAKKETSRNPGRMIRALQAGGK